MNAALPREALGKTLKSKGRAVGKKYQRPFFSFSCVVLLPPPHHHPRLLPPRTNPFVVCSAVDCGRMLLCHSVTTDLREKDTTCEERAADDRTSREGGGEAWRNKTLHTQKSVKPLSALPSPDQSDIHQQCDSPLGELQERSKVVFLLLIRATQAALDLEISKKKKKKEEEGEAGRERGGGGRGAGEMS